MDRYPDPDMENLAGVLDRRLEALLVDVLLVAVVVGVLGYVAGTALDVPLGDLGGLFLALQFGAPLGLLLYQTAFEGYFGRTVGKSVRGIVVVREDGSRCTWGAAVIRNLLRLVDTLPAFYLVGIVSAFLSDDHQRVGDHAAKTVVVSAAE